MPKKLRKNQEMLDIIDEIRKGLGDTGAKNYGLYVKLYKKVGKVRMRKAFYAAVRKDITDKKRYFLGILWHKAKEKENLTEYHKMRSNMMQKMTLLGGDIPKKRKARA